MARFYVEGARADANDLRVWDRIEREFADDPDERRAARVLYQLTGHHPFLWDTGGRQRAVDIYLRSPSGDVTVVEVSSTFDPVLRRDTDNAFRLKQEIAAVYAGTASWVLHFHKGWDVPPTKQRRRLAQQISGELKEREATHESGYLRAAPLIYAWAGAHGTPGVEIGGWDSRVGQARGRVSDRFAEYFESEPLTRKRRKLAEGASALGASSRHLYLFTTPAGTRARLGSAHLWDLTDGSFALPADVDCVWLDSLNTTVRRFSAAEGWATFSL